MRVINDATMQALGSYEGGRMLFLGLGTGLGATLILDGTVEPMEIGHMPYKRGRTFEDYAGERGRKRLGNKKWRKAVAEVVTRLKEVLEVDYVVLGGGNAARLKQLPEGVRLGDNLNAFKGGLHLWRGDDPLAVSISRRQRAAAPRGHGADERRRRARRAGPAAHLVQQRQGDGRLLARAVTALVHRSAAASSTRSITRESTFRRSATSASSSPTDADSGWR